MFGIEEPKIDVQSRFDFQVLRLIEIAGIDILYFGILIQDELFSEVRAIDGTIVPKRRQSFIMVCMEMS
jgi:hypothetical protein